MIYFTIWLYFMGAKVVYHSLQRVKPGPTWANISVDVVLTSFWPLAVTVAIILISFDFVYQKLKPYLERMFNRA